MTIGLALGSGGAKGFAHIAYLEAIDELGIQITSIAAASMGAFIGAYYAGGMPAKELHKLAKSFSLQDFSKVIDLTKIRVPGLIQGKKIEKFLLDTLPVHRFEDLKIPLKIVATDYWNKEEFVFEHGPIVPAVRASISIPGLFQPYEYNGKLYIDGGVVNPVPFDLLIGDADFIIAIDVSGEKEIEEKKLPHTIQMLHSTFQIMQKVIIRHRETGHPIDIYCKPGLIGYKILEFYKAEDIIKSVKADVEDFKNELTGKGLPVSGVQPVKP
jgi:NTE family protein